MRVISTHDRRHTLATRNRRPDLDRLDNRRGVCRCDFSCWRTALLAREKNGGIKSEPPAMWFASVVILFLFGVNKQLDLQTAFIQFGGQVALHEGWYEHRRQVQIIFVMLLA